MVSFSLMEWDSSFFGYKIALLQFSQQSIAQLEQTICKLKEENYKLAYCFIRPEDTISNDTIIICSGLLVDEKVTYSYSIDKQKIYHIDDQVVTYNNNKESAELVKLTLQSGVHSRFRIDSNFKNSEYENLYKEWIRKSVVGELADQVFVYEEEGHILGFITLKITESHGSIGLLAVDENFRGKSIGKKLLTSAFAFFHNNSITRVEVVTQRGNQIACRFYESCGFNINEIVNVYHLWIK